MKKILQILIVLVIGFSLNSCYYDDYPEIAPDNGGGSTATPVSYATDIMPLWAQCVGCHSGNTAPDLRDANSYTSLLNGYVTPNDAANSILYKSLIGSGAPLMPPGSKWSSTKINLVKNWINQGTLNN
ncbi:hypothetical protein [Lutibacter sp.]|uniref:hypothetical protein n=1 Tax=Lutibacter sp. TaxID=1925666 RepID=UPI0025BAB03C|nr:hypothetical protein [Lutibacter sp.]MCF6180767.1 hypothetical protein [Lutibacter sp.]